MVTFVEKVKSIYIANVFYIEQLFTIVLIILASSFVSSISFAQIDNNFTAGGGIKIGDSTTTCDGTTEGAIRFDADAGKTLDYCNGTGWLSVLTSSFAGVVNNGNSYAAPMIIGTNDNNTLSFETNGTTHVTIDTSGNVGIGDVSPNSHLEVSANGGSGGAALMVSSDDGNNGDLFIVNEDGYIGIGTSSPASHLHVANNAEAYFDRAGANWYSAPGINYRRARGTEASPSDVASGDSLGDFFFRGYASSQYVLTSAIGTRVDSAPSGSNVPTAFTYSTTANNGGLWTERFRISSGGNVGIGTDNPNVALDVIGDVEYTGTITDVSDRRLKENIQPIEHALETVNAIDGVSFVMKGDESRRVEFGVIAQEVEEVLPELVHTADDEMKSKSVNYIGFIGWIIEAIKELASRDNEIQFELSQKDKRIQSLEKKLILQQQELENLKALIEQEKR